MSCITPRLSSGPEIGRAIEAYHEKPRFSCRLLQADVMQNSFDLFYKDSEKRINSVTIYRIKLYVKLSAPSYISLLFFND